MSLFEKIKNKRYNLQEAIDDKGNITPEPGDKAIEKSIVRRQRKINKKESKNQNRNIETNKQQGKKILQNINKNKNQPSGEKSKIQTGSKPPETLDTMAKNIAKQDIEAEGGKFKQPVSGTSQAKDFKPKPGSQKLANTTAGGPVKVIQTTPYKPPSKKKVKEIMNRSTLKKLEKGQGVNVNKSSSPTITGNVDSKKALEYTKKINEKNPKRPEYVKKDVYKGAEEITKKINPKQSRPLGQLVKKTKPSKTSVSGKLTPGQIDFSKSAELASKRKARINPKTGKATQAGVKDFAMNRGGFGRRSANMSQSDFKKMVTGDPKTAKSFKKIVTDAERIASNPQSKAYKDIEKKINTSDYAGKEARKRPAGSKTFAQVKREIDAKEKAYQTKTLPKQKKLAKKFLVNPQKRDAVIKKVGSQNVAFKQTATQFANKVQGGKSKPIVKKAIKALSKIGPAGRIAAATGLVLLNPGARKLAKNIGRTAFSGFTGSKTPVKQQTTKMGINLSPGSSTASSKYSLKRQELLRKNPNKVTNKNLA